MMPYALELEQDQIRIEGATFWGEASPQKLASQDNIAQVFRIAGESDGYEGTYPQHDNYEYLSGYVMGVWRYRAQEISKQSGDAIAPF